MFIGTINTQKVDAKTNTIILNQLIDCLIELGASHPVLELYGYYDFVGKDNLPTETMQKLWAKAYEITGNKKIGEYVAEHSQPALLKELGLSMLTSKSLKEGLYRIVRYSSLFSSGLAFNLVETNETGVNSKVVLQVFQADPSFEYSFFAVDFTLALLRRFSQLTVANNSLSLTMKNHVNASENDRLLEIESNQNTLDRAHLMAEISFLKHELERTLSLEDEALTNHYEDQLSFKLRNSIEIFSQEVIHYLSASTDWPRKTAKDLAQAFNMTLRTFHRRLAKEGTHYSKLLMEFKYKLALDALVNKHMTVTQTAYLLGYHDVASFSKAFKRWDGRSPSARMT